MTNESLRFACCINIDISLSKCRNKYDCLIYSFFIWLPKFWMQPWHEMARTDYILRPACIIASCYSSSVCSKRKWKKLFIPKTIKWNRNSEKYKIHMQINHTFLLCQYCARCMPFCVYCFYFWLVFFFFGRMQRR